MGYILDREEECIPAQVVAPIPAQAVGYTPVLAGECILVLVGGYILDLVVACTLGLAGGCTTVRVVVFTPGPVGDYIAALAGDCTTVRVATPIEVIGRQEMNYLITCPDWGCMILSDY